MNRILIVTIGLVGRSGTEIVTLETARGLRGRGHEVAIFTPEIGPLGRALLREGIIVVDDAAAIPWTPTVIQANQTFPLIQVVARFPGVPVISICHDASIWYNERSICRASANMRPSAWRVATALLEGSRMWPTISRCCTMPSISTPIGTEAPWRPRRVAP